ncbi:MAG: VOC family protein [Planctomycetota bacterium]
MKPPPLLGLHHITAITGDAQANLDFYTQTLGLTLVKVTVNFDDPGSYHFYYGDETGSPGSIVTFFAWPRAKSGVVGKGQPTGFKLSTPQTTTERDIDGIAVDASVARPARLLHADLQSANVDASNAFATEQLGLTDNEGDSNGTCYFLSDDQTISITDYGRVPGRLGAGVIHHIAFRTENPETQRHWRDHLLGHGVNVSPVMDRDYFTSIYFREPGGVLFEIATDGPGFGVDEDEPGTTLKLPTMYEPQREKIEAVLPTITLPNGKTLP